MAGCDRRQEGFSLIEVLVALVILAVGLLGLAVFQVTAIKGNAIASKWTVGTELAQDRLERFRHVGWDNIVSSAAGGFTAGPPPAPVYANLPAAAGDNTTVRGTRFYRVWSVTTDTPSLKTITVWSCWQDDQAVWHNVMLVTQRSNIGGI
ncbi:MAG: prepilin-type N-terminal cleavage/methylation domain-containing protein [Deltaproteobacteria bacterium]|nr:prepilin-type N-terminal cleavage/methylation domain-containing protein [Deltaproteobacteria bacterium]